MGLITGHPAASNRIEVIADFGGERVAGARACFSRAVVERYRASNVVEQLVSGPETRCLPADEVLSLPAGSWHLYVVADDPFLISTHPTSFHRSSASSDDADVLRVLSHLVPAATIDLGGSTKKLAPDESLALYVTNIGSDVSAPSLVPVPPGVQEMPVPARVPIVPLILRGTTIVAVGERIVIEQRKRAIAVFPARPHAVVVVPYELVSQVDITPTMIHFMHRRLGKGVAEYKLAPTEKRGLVFAENIERGKINVLVESAVVTANPLEVFVGADAAGRVVTSGDLTLNAGIPRTKISWEIDDQFANDLRASTECAAPIARDRALLSLFSCADAKTVTRFRDLDQCTLFHETALSLENDRTGSVDWAVPTDLTNVVAVMTYGGISAFGSVNTARRTGTDIVRLMPRYITGRITLRDEPVLAEVACSGPVLMTDATGYYRCWRPAGAPPVVYVMPCDGLGNYQQTFPEEATVVDVKLATNALVVKVEDPSGSPVQDAHVTLWEGSPFQVPEPQVRLLGPTSESGEVKVTRLEPREVALCADKQDFRRSCKEHIRIEHDERNTVTLTLHAQDLTRGRVLSPASIADGRLFVMLGPTQIGEADVDRDGSFSLPARPPSNATFVMVSSSLPLCVLRRDPSATGLDLRLPVTRPKASIVSSDTIRSGITLELGGALVSSNAFLRHQMLRHRHYVVAPSQPVMVDAVDASEGITVVVGFVGVVDAPAGDPANLPRYPVVERATIHLP